ncbi:MAG: hypothetical protein ACHBN1_15855 [Heteroscytonema crispum UTEX LB 1556]
MFYLISHPDLETTINFLPVEANSESAVIVAAHSSIPETKENVSNTASPEKFAPEYSSKDAGNIAQWNAKASPTTPENISDNTIFYHTETQQQKLSQRASNTATEPENITSPSFSENNIKLESTVNSTTPENEATPSFSRKNIEIKSDNAKTAEKQFSNFKLLKVKVKLGKINMINSILARGQEDASQAIEFEKWLLPYEAIIKILKFDVVNLPDGQLELRSPGFVTRIKPKKLRKDSELGLVFSISDLQRLFNIAAEFDIKNQAIILNASWLGESQKQQNISSQTSVKPGEKPKENSQANGNYIIPRRIIPKKTVNTFTTTLPLNGRTINHLTESEVIGGLGFGDAQNTTFDVNALFPLNSQITESFTNNILTVEQTGNYLQLQTVRKTNEITITKKEPRTLIGTEIELSLTGSCILPGNNADSQCAYTPSIVTDKNSIDPNTLFPAAILQPSKFGDAVTPESLAAMKQPGFQMGANGQQIGIDLFFPNAGSSFGNTQSNKTSVSREERIENTPVGFYSTVRQIVKVNDQEAVIGRTVRGFGFIADDKNTLLNTALQLGSLILPDADPEIAGGPNPPNKNINRNLFFAANNAWIPTNSFTIYHSGIGRAETPKQTATDIRQAPPAIFGSMWLGLSPITKRSFSSKSSYELTSPSRVLVSAGAEGGFDSNINFLSIVNGQSFSTKTLEDFYAQIYLTMFNQEANFISYSQFTEQTSYVPHISLSGNITGTQDVFRYYSGMLGGEKINAYLGADYTKNTLNGWTYLLGGIAYTNPDYDYYSQVRASVSKKINLSKNANLLLSSGLNYAFDRNTNIGGIIFNSPVNSVTLGARANIGNVSFGLVNYFGGILSDSIKNTLRADLAIKFSDNFQLSAYYTPINENYSRSRYGIGAQFQLDNNKKSPILSLSWNNNEYNLGFDSGKNNLGVSNNSFMVFLKSNF